MKTFRYLLAAILLMAFAGCAHHRDGSSVWAGGLWVLPLIPIIGAVLFIRAAMISYKSGWDQLTQDGHYYEGKEKLPFWKNQYGFLTYAAACLIAAAFIIINVVSNK